VEVPDKIGSYEVLGPAGEGGMGLVFLAKEPGLDRRVAIKFPKDAPGEAGELLRERFARESRTLSAVRHPNLITLYEVGEHEGRPYAVMEWIEGSTLDHKVRQEGALDPSFAARLVAKVAMATHYLHLNGYLHRDIKPENILLREGEPVLADMGLVKNTYDDDGDASLTIAGRALGTPDYAAPELVKGDLEAMGPRSDVFGLGATLYFSLTGRAPRGPSPTIKEFLAQQVAPPTRYRKDLDPALSDLCRRALSLSPDLRFRSAQSFADALIRWAMIKDQGKAIYGKGFATLWQEEQPFDGFGSRPLDLGPSAVARWALPLSVMLAGVGLLTFGLTAYLVMSEPPRTLVLRPKQAPLSPGDPRAELAKAKAAWMRVNRSHLEETKALRGELARAKRDLEEQVKEALAARPLAEGARLEALRQELQTLRRRLKTLAASQQEFTDFARKEAPHWFTILPNTRRPALPLPPGVVWGSEPKRYRHPMTQSDLVWVPPSTAGRIDTAGFFVGVHEVTQAQFLEFCDQTGHGIPAGLARGEQEDALPVANLTYQDAVAYCRWAGVRLPNDCEWLLAALGPKEQDWPWGHFPDETCWSDRPLPVGSLPQGASPYGALDFASNVSEWVSESLPIGGQGQQALGPSFLFKVPRVVAAKRWVGKGRSQRDVGFRFVVPGK
jgi:formylglycine-generating enzyme required for sulfatase activity